MKVGFIGLGNGIGDSIFALKALYCLKMASNAEIVYFGNKSAKNMFEYCDFIDKCVDIGDLSEGVINYSQATFFNEEKCDIIILSVIKSSSFSILRKADVKYIVCATKVFSLFSFKSRTIPIYYVKKYANMSKEDIVVHYALVAASILGCKDRFETILARVNAADYKIRFSDRQKAFVDRFFDFVYHAVDSKISKSMVLINPFSITARKTLSLNGFLRLIEEIGKLNVCIVIPAYMAVADSFANSFKEYFSFDILRFGDSDEKIIANNNIFLFENNDDLLNLIALMQHISLCISPSTGIIHMASNQQIESIGLFSKPDSIKWATASKKYVILDDEINEELVIANTIKSTKEALKLP